LRDNKTCSSSAIYVTRLGIFQLPYVVKINKIPFLTHLAINNNRVAKKQKYYTVWEGAKIGVFESWDDCKKQVHGYPTAKYKSFETRAEAEAALRKPYYAVIKTAATTTGATQKMALMGKPNKESLAVDAACSGNPGDMEYRGVYVATREEIFHIGPLPEGTNNIGEFLAIVHGLAILKKQASNVPIYTDSRTAMAWIKHKHCKTTLERTSRNAPIFDLISRAEAWLATNTYDTPIVKWETEAWGEIPADFGRK
jgi:ribonuclease HI